MTSDPSCECIILVRPDLTIEEITGYSSVLPAKNTDMLNQPVTALIHPDDRERITDILASALKDDTSKRAIVRFGPPKNHLCDIDALYVPNQGLQLTLRCIDSIFRIQQELNTNAEESRQIFDFVDTIAVKLDTNGNITRINRQGLELLGYEEDELLGKNWYETIVPNGKRSERFDNILRNCNTGEAIRLKGPIRKKDGAERTIGWSIMLLTDENGTPTGYFARGEDITDRLLRENLIQTQRNVSLRLIDIPTIEEAIDFTLAEVLALTNSDCGLIYEKDLKGDFRLIASKITISSKQNPPAVFMKDSRESSILFNQRALFTHCCELDRIGLCQDRPLSGGSVAILPVLNDMYMIVCTSEPGELWQRLSKSLESIAAILGNAVERIRNRIRMENSEKKYRQIVENTNEAIAVVRNFRFVFCNRKIRELTGYSNEELYNMEFVNLIYPEDRELVIQIHRKRIAGDTTPHRYSLRTLTKTGETIWMRISSVMFYWEGTPSTLVFLSNINDIKAFEKKLAESEKRYRILTENSTDIISQITRDGVFRYVSVAAENHTGYRPEELTNRSIYDFLVDEDREKVRDALLNIGNHVNFSFVYRIIGADGSERWMESSGAEFEHSDILLVTRNVTKRIKAEKRLRNRFRFVKEILDAVPNPIVYKNQAGIVMGCNEAFSRLAGKPYDRIAGRNLTETALGTEFFHILSQKESSLQTDSRSIEFDFIFRKKGMPAREMRALESRFTEMNGNPGGYVLSITDITDIKRIKKDALLKTGAIEHSINAIAMIDKHNIITYVNPSFLNMWRFSNAAEAVNLNFNDLFLLKQTEEEEVSGSLIEKGSWIGETFGVRSNGSRFNAHVVLTAIKDATGEIDYRMASVTDISARKREELENKKLLGLLLKSNNTLEQLNIELQRSNNDLQEFAYVASHDLQEPLRMVASYVQLLGRRYKGRLDSDADEFIGYAVDGAKRMQKLISDLLIWSRVGTKGRPFEWVDLDAVVDRTLQNLRVSIQATGAEIVKDRLPTLFADPVQMGQLMQNLIGNALKYRSEDNPRIVISAEVKNGQHRITVADNGIGIDPQYRDRIFIIFQRLHTNEKYTGTGIGLALCKKIVERHSGRIWVESSPSGGASFSFTIPEKAGEEKDVRKAA